MVDIVVQCWLWLVSVWLVVSWLVFVLVVLLDVFFFSVGRVGWAGLGLFFVVFCEMIDMMLLGLLLVILLLTSLCRVRLYGGF